MTRLQSRKSILMSGTAALVAIAAVATAALAADISTTGYQDLVNDQKMLSPEVKALIDATGAANAVADSGAVLSSRVELVGENQSAVAIGNSADQTLAVDRASIELAPPVPYDLSEEPVAYVGHETVVSNGRSTS